MNSIQVGEEDEKEFRHDNLVTNCIHTVCG